MRHKQLRVIVDFNVRYKAARDMIDGILHYAVSHPHWELLMRGGRPHPRTISIKSAIVIERLSTTDLTRSGDRVNRAMDFIRTHCRERIGVAQTAHAVGGCVRLLEKDFKAVLGKSICHAIQDCRLQQVTKALRSSSAPLANIARQSGFASETYLKSLFKKRYGMTMSEYRETD